MKKIFIILIVAVALVTLFTFKKSKEIKVQNTKTQSTEIQKSEVVENYANAVLGAAEDADIIIPEHTEVKPALGLDVTNINLEPNTGRVVITFTKISGTDPLARNNTFTLETNTTTLGINPDDTIQRLKNDQKFQQYLQQRLNLSSAK